MMMSRAASTVSPMRHILSVTILSICLTAAPKLANAQPAFANGIIIDGATLDATGAVGANEGRFGFFSDLYYDPAHNEWWALSDRGPGGGTLPYRTRLQRIALNVHPVTGRISHLRIKDTIIFTDPNGLLYPASASPYLDGLNPFALTGNAGLLGNSFDPEGLVVDPRTGHFLVTDEYGPSLYEFDRQGRLVYVFETPQNLVPKAGVNVNYVAPRDVCGGALVPPFC